MSPSRRPVTKLLWSINRKQVPYLPLPSESSTEKGRHLYIPILRSGWFKLPGTGTLQFQKTASKIFNAFFRVADPDPSWIRIQSGQWIRIRIRNPDPDPGG
jgi:hypothetical protein